MALGARSYELRLFVVAQNQASATLRRVSSDLRALQKQTTLQQRAEQLAIRQATINMRMERNRQRIAAIGPGGSRRLAMEQAQARLRRDERSTLRRLAGIDQQRLSTNTQLLRNRERQLRINEKIARGGLSEAQLARGVGGPRGQRLAMLSTANQRQLAELHGRMRLYGLDVRGLRAALKDLDIQQAKLNAQMKEAAVDVRRLATENELLARQSRALALAQAEIAKAIRLQRWERLQQIGRTFSHIGRTFQYFGLIATAALGAATAAAANFETQVSLAATQARDIDAPLSQVAVRTGQITQQIEGLMGRFPATSEEMANSAYDIYSSINLMNDGVTDMSKGLEFMTAANKLAVAGLSDLGTATNTMITLVNNFDPQQRHLNETLDTMFDIVRFGRMRMEDFNNMLTSLAPAARGADQSLRDIGGAMAFLTQIMPSQQRAGTGLARLLEVFANTDVQRGLKQLGIDAVDAQGKLLPLDKVIANIVERLPELQRGGPGLENFFKIITQLGRAVFQGRPGAGREFTIQGRRVFQALITGADEYLTRQKQIDTNTGEFLKSFRAQTKTAGNQWHVFLNQLRLTILTVGKDLIPVFREVGRYLQRFVKWFRDLDPEQRKFLTKGLAIAGLLSLVGGMLLSLGAGFLTLTGTLGLFIGSLGATEAAAAGASTRLGMAGLLGILQRLALIGAIAIILKTVWSGDASARDFLLGALAGGIFGARFGPGGAVIGAITVPVIMSIVQRGDPGTLLEQQFKRAFERSRVGLGEYLKGPFADFSGEDAFDKMYPTIDAFVNRVANQLRTLGFPAGVISLRTRFDFSRMATEALKAGQITQQAYLRGMELVGFDSQAIANQRQRFLNDTIESIRGHRDVAGAAKATGKQLTAEQQEILKLRDALEKLNRETGSGANKQKQLADAVKNATEQAQREIQQAAQNLSQTWLGLLQENKQRFGELFQGPWLQSEFGQTAEEWDISPRIQDLTKDLRMQLNEFNRFNSGLAAIARRGGPAELIDELKQLGPDALDKIEVLRKAAPGQFNQFITVWRQKQKAIEQATKIDFDKQLQQWFRYGKGIAQQIIFGLRSENVALDNAFKKYITEKFPDYVNEAIAAARKEAGAKTGTAKTPVKLPGTKPMSVTNVTDNTKIEVNAQPGEATMDTARRTHHLWKAGARRAGSKIQERGTK